MNRVFKAISDPTRREILKLLHKRDMNAGEIAENFSISKPAITKHLNILKDAELISAEKDANFIIYSINTSVLQETLIDFINIFQKGEKYE